MIKPESQRLSNNVGMSRTHDIGVDGKILAADSVRWPVLRNSGQDGKEWTWSDVVVMNEPHRRLSFAQSRGLMNG